MSRKLKHFVCLLFLLGFVSSANGVEGLLGEYYEWDTANPWQTLLLKRLDPQVGFNWGSASGSGCTGRWFYGKVDGTG